MIDIKNKIIIVAAVLAW